jgi:hypothetical protein
MWTRILVSVAIPLEGWLVRGPVGLAAVLPLAAWLGLRKPASYREEALEYAPRFDHEPMKLLEKPDSLWPFANAVLVVIASPMLLRWAPPFAPLLMVQAVLRMPKPYRVPFVAATYLVMFTLYMTLR